MAAPTHPLITPNTTADAAVPILGDIAEMMLISKELTQVLGMERVDQACRPHGATSGNPSLLVYSVLHPKQIHLQRPQCPAPEVMP